MSTSHCFLCQHVHPRHGRRCAGRLNSREPQRSQIGCTKPPMTCQTSRAQQVRTQRDRWRHTPTAFCAVLALCAHACCCCSICQEQFDKAHPVVSPCLHPGSHCQLGRRPWAHRFKQPLAAAYAAAVFHSIVAGRAAAAKQLGAPAPQLSRFDLFHGHFFIAATNSSTDSSSTTSPQLGLRGLKGPRARRTLVTSSSTQHQQQPSQQQQPAVGILVSVSSVCCRQHPLIL